MILGLVVVPNITGKASASDTYYCCNDNGVWKTTPCWAHRESWCVNGAAGKSCNDVCNEGQQGIGMVVRTGRMTDGPQGTASNRVRCECSGGDPRAPEPWCRDSDTNAQHPDGNNTVTAGTCQDSNGGGGTDACNNQNQWSPEGVDEYFCDDRQQPTVCRKALMDSCSSFGMVCQNGGCVQQQGGGGRGEEEGGQEEQEQQEEQEETCRDTDGGIDYNNKGTVTNSSGVFTDFCYNAQRVHEYGCMDEFERQGWPDPFPNCLEGEQCGDGACKELRQVPGCTDTDGGDVPGRKGTCTDIFNRQSTDVCNNDQWGNSNVTEYFCENHLCESKRHDCPGGCSNGACLASIGRPQQGGFMNWLKNLFG